MMKRQVANPTRTSTQRVMPLLALVLACGARPTLSEEGDDGGSSGDGSSSSTSSGGSSSGGSSSGGSSSGGGSSSSSSGDGDTTTEEDEDGGAFIQEPDGGDSDMECDPWAQDCPEGQKCVPWANDGGNWFNATKCSPVVPNPKAVGETCTAVGSGVSGEDDCEHGAMCWDVDWETLEGYCVALCTGSWAAPTCPDPCSFCWLDDALPAQLCLPTCDPLEDSCREGEVCLPDWYSSAFFCGPDASGDAGAYKDPCEYVNACDQGLFCANADVVPGCEGSQGCCTPFCDLEAADPGCPDANLGVECVPYFEEGEEPSCLVHDVGMCVLP